MSFREIADSFSDARFRSVSYEKECHLFENQFSVPFDIKTLQLLIWNEREHLEDFIQVSDRGKQIGVDHRNKPNSLPWVYDRIDEGYSVAFNRPERVSAEIARSLSDFKRTTNLDVASSFFYTPPHGECFQAHIDGIDVIFLQLEGQKEWMLQEGTRYLPLREEGKEMPFSDSKPVSRITLTPGQCLYVPRGHIHRGLTGESASLHISIGIYPTLVRDTLKQLIDSVAKVNSNFRKTLDVNLRDKEQMKNFIRESAQMLNEAAISIDREEIDYMSYINTSSHFIETPDSYRQLKLHSEVVDFDALYVANKSINIILKIKNFSCEIRFRRQKKDEIILLPMLVYTTLEKVFSGDEFSITDLPQEIDITSLRKILERLIKLKLIVQSQY